MAALSVASEKGSNSHDRVVAYTRMCPSGLAGKYLCRKGLRLRIQAHMSDKPGSACGVRQMKPRLFHLSPGSGHDDRLEADRSHGRREDRENTVELLAGASAELVAMRTIFAADQMGLPASTMHVLSSGVAGTMAANRTGVQMDTLRNPLLARVLTLRVYVFLGAMPFAAGLFVTMHVFGVR